MAWSRPVARSSSLVTLGACVLAAATFVSGAMEARVRAQAARGSVLLFGSSSMQGMLGRVIAEDFEQLGFDVMRQGVISGGLARPDFRDVPQMLGALPIVRRSSVLLYLGVNDAKALWLRPSERAAGDKSHWIRWDDERWDSIYAARMVSLIDSLCERGAEHTFVLSPADVAREPLQLRLERVRLVQQRAADASKCGVYIPTTGDPGNFEIEGRALRSRDGVHMTRTGALTAWGRIRSRVLTVLGYSDRDSRAAATF